MALVARPESQELLSMHQRHPRFPLPNPDMQPYSIPSPRLDDAHFVNTAWRSFELRLPFYTGYSANQNGKPLLPGLKAVKA